MGNVRFIFTGLCAFLPDKELGRKDAEPGKMMVLMIDATHESRITDPLDRRPLRRHFPLAFFKASAVYGADCLKGAGDEELRWFFYRRHCRFVPEPKVDGKNDFKVVQYFEGNLKSGENYDDFNWGAHIKEIVKDSSSLTLHPAWSAGPASYGLIASRFELTCGRLSTYDLNERVEWEFPSTLGPQFPPRALSNFVALDFVDIKKVSLIATNMDKPGDELVLDFGSEDRDVEVVIGNLCAESLEPPRREVYSGPEAQDRDEDFRWFYELFDDDSKERIIQELQGISLPSPIPVRVDKGGGYKPVQCFRVSLHAEDLGAEDAERQAVVPMPTPEFHEAGGYFHVQETLSWCGAAVALTMLSDSDIGVDPRSITQRELYDVAHEASAESWLVDPYGLRDSLEAKKGSGSPFSFSAERWHAEPRATARIVSAIVGDQPVPAATLVNGPQHWVSINGVDTEGDPRNGDYRLLRLWVYDPENFDQPPRMHFQGDSCPRVGSPDYCFFYPDGWRSALTGLVYKGQPGYFTVAVSSDLALSDPGTIDPPNREIVRGNDRLVDRDFALELCAGWLELYGPWPPGSLAERLLSGATPVALRRMDIKGKKFYLIVMESAGASVASVLMNASTGDLHSIKIHREESPFRKMLGRLREEFLDEELFWRPSLESSSPHSMFRIFNEEGGTEFQRLVDGKRFNRLTTEVFGA
jgi:hypothetical protein